MKFRKKPVWLAVISTFGLLIMPLFQNCSSGNFNASVSSSSTLPGEMGNGSGSQPEPGKGPPPLPPPVAIGGTVTDLKIENTSSTDMTNVPVTFGQVFPQGAVASTETLAGKLSDDSLLALQVETKATHPDGSIRHAVISAVIPKLTAGQNETLNLIKASKSSDSSTALTPQDLMNAGFGATVNINIGGQVYSASPDQALRSSSYKTWLSGPLANEWLVAVPFKTAGGTTHPHLMGRFAIRSYTGLNRAKVDFVIENNWAYEPGPQNFLYDVQIILGGQTVYTKMGLNHYHHARWKKTYWWGAEPAVNLRHNAAYLMLSRAVPNYDPTVVIPEHSNYYGYDGLAEMAANWTGPGIEPMGTGFTYPGMPGVGGRQDIGLLPGWDAKYLISQDPRAKKGSLGTADLAGSFSMHYRDKNTDLPLSIVDWPYSTLLGHTGDTVNPATNKSEAFPDCGGDCNTPDVKNPSGTVQYDSSHEPHLAYLPYLVTGDHYYLEEMHFWAMFNMFQHNPYYRDFDKGLFKPDQGRGQAWSLRTLGAVAFITPDNHPLKAQFEKFLSNNLDWYNTTYTNDPTANKLGVIINGYVIGYNNGRGLAPWQDDFFTQAVGFVADLGYSKAQTLLAWKAKFPISRMTDPGYCWIMGAAYSVNVRDTETSPLYTTMDQVYKGTFPADFTSLTCASPEMAAHDLLKLKVGEMLGWSDSSEGYPSNMQPALAYSATSGAPNGGKAWQVFMNRTVKPNYGLSPQFAIVPR